MEVEQPSASYVSNKSIKMENTVTLVLTPKGYVRCAASKYLTLLFTNKAMYNTSTLAVLFSVAALLFSMLDITKLTMSLSSILQICSLISSDSSPNYQQRM